MRMSCRVSPETEPLDRRGDENDTCKRTGQSQQFIRDEAGNVSSSVKYVEGRQTPSDKKDDRKELRRTNTHSSPC